LDYKPIRRKAKRLRRSEMDGEGKCRGGGDGTSNSKKKREGKWAFVDL
jgi:hypothetical protein